MLSLRLLFGSRFIRPTQNQLLQSRYRTLVHSTCKTMTTLTGGPAVASEASTATTIKFGDTEEEVNIVREGKAEVYFQKSVFYNPVQEFNRDLTINVVNEFAKEFFIEKRNKAKKKVACSSEENGVKDVDVPDPAELQAGIQYKDGMRVLEGLAASGLRSVRFALEVPGVKEIIVNDYDHTAVKYIEKNLEKNEVAHLARANFGDASMLMYQNRQPYDRFDVVDVDPYGSPSRFLDAAVQAVSDGGLLCVTCTDMGVLCGNNGEASYTKYGSYAVRSPCCHEIALRSILHSLDSHASRYSRYIVPLLSVSVDFYIRVFVKVYTGQFKAKQSASKQSLIYRCAGCGAQYLQPLGDLEIKGTNTRFVAATGPPVNQMCEHCGQKHKVSGPIWSDRIHDFDFLGRVIEGVKKNKDKFGTAERMIGMLSMMHEELPDVPLYYVADELSSVMHCEVTPTMKMRSAILNLGHKVSFSHAAKNSIKTTAPVGVIWDIMRHWIKEHPVSKKRLVTGSVVKNILDKEITSKVCFELRDDANPESRKRGLQRWKDMPENWGPMSRAKKSPEREPQAPEKKRKLSEEEKSHKTDVEMVDEVTSSSGTKE
ncbi:tRNA (guanine(26)-N(2))-dimethyltransferase-like [Lineus longissimus]|uniref:tRNA (guanine(26)-N(2))-dimethyltransferase-like n=1 Tax=Lineus longissimus TaxID=88925 RepID=UPI002B4D7C9E